MAAFVPLLPRERPYITTAELKVALGGTAASYHGRIKRALARQDLIKIRRGLFCLGPELRRQPLDLFVLAARIYGPSYISLETALSVHGLIPEHVATITSCSSVRSRNFDTPVGLFSYSRVPSAVMLQGVERIEVAAGPYLLASPWKAIVDYVFVYKHEWTGLEPLKKSLRIDSESLPIDRHLLEILEGLYRSSRVTKFINSIIR